MPTLFQVLKVHLLLLIVSTGFFYVLLLQVVSAMVNNDLISIANTRPLKSWKETLALFCTVSLISPRNHI